MKCHKITVFEHESIRVDRGENKISPCQLDALHRFYGEKGVPFYYLIHNGVKFNEFVGVLQVGKTTIEVLPKADKNSDEDKWRKVLIFMLNTVGVFDIHAPSNSDLKLRNNSILDLYFELFVKELEYLLRRGLIKKYRVSEGNKSTLKGSIHFGKHLSKNLIHQERFYIKYSTYDKDHEIHAILYKALKLLYLINTNEQLNSRLGALILNFPELYDINITDSLFKKIVYDRKTEQYKNAIEIARLILLNYHPDVCCGINNVLALMFDMNLLWEKFVYISLRRYKKNSISIKDQNSRYFWKSQSGKNSKIRPDIVLNIGEENCIVLDTKWKNIYEHNPSINDLRQMFVYMKFYGAKKVALIYPGSKYINKSGLYYNHKNVGDKDLSDEQCCVISLCVDYDFKAWETTIRKMINDWCD
ncbi:restriction endonuclease [Marinilabiliaceae bacterium JC040]|nr:restriction endonuclease [Marinilabiliaceae bacterium JC040]